MIVSDATNATTGPPFPGTGDKASRRSPVPRFCSGYSRSSARPTTSISAAAWATEMLRFKRPPISSHVAARFVSTSVPWLVTVGAMLIGTHTSRARTPVP
jgi:hypothetical protein